RRAGGARRWSGQALPGRDRRRRDPGASVAEDHRRPLELRRLPDQDRPGDPGGPAPPRGDLTGPLGAGAMASGSVVVLAPLLRPREVHAVRVQEREGQGEGAQGLGKVGSTVELEPRLLGQQLARLRSRTEERAESATRLVVGERTERGGRG